MSVPLILMGLLHAEIAVEATKRMEPISTSENSGGSWSTDPSQKCWILSRSTWRSLILFAVPTITFNVPFMELVHRSPTIPNKHLSLISLQGGAHGNFISVACLLWSDETQLYGPFWKPGGPKYTLICTQTCRVTLSTTWVWWPMDEIWNGVRHKGEVVHPSCWLPILTP